MRAWRPSWPRGGVAILAILALITVALVTVVQFAGSRRVTGNQGTTGACSPQPCLNVNNYLLWVGGVTESEGIVRMQISFRNSSDATHAAPEDLRLIDAKQQSWSAIQDPAGCTHWTRTEFNNGARFGPITVCFHPSSTDPPLTLRWSPDMGLFCCQADLKVKSAG